MRENDIQRQIIDYLERVAGFVVIRTNAGQIYHKGHMIKLAVKGTSDLVACSPSGRFWAIEIKQEGKKTTMQQTAFLERINKKGGVGVMVWSLEHMRQILKERYNRVG